MMRTTRRTPESLGVEGRPATSGMRTMTRRTPESLGVEGRTAPQREAVDL